MTRQVLTKICGDIRTDGFELYAVYDGNDVSLSVLEDDVNATHKLLMKTTDFKGELKLLDAVDYLRSINNELKGGLASELLILAIANFEYNALRDKLKK